MNDLELLASNSPGEFVVAFLEAHGIFKQDYDSNASGSRSVGATIDTMYGRWGSRSPKPSVQGLTLILKEAEGGGEGEGESVYRVYGVAKDGVEFAYFATNGYYASEYGIDWDDTFTTVYPHKVTVTQYHTNKQ